MPDTAPKNATPLIPESLVRLYRRMARAFSAPALPDAVAVARLSRAVELHHGAAAAVEAAGARSDAGARGRLEELSSEERRLAHAIGGLVIELGGSPPRPDESFAALPRDPRAMSRARDQEELIRFVRENVSYVAAVDLALRSASDIPSTIRHRLEVLAAAADGDLLTFLDTDLARLARDGSSDRGASD